MDFYRPGMTSLQSSSIERLFSPFDPLLRSIPAMGDVVWMITCCRRSRRYRKEIRGMNGYACHMCETTCTKGVVICFLWFLLLVPLSLSPSLSCWCRCLITHSYLQVASMPVSCFSTPCLFLPPTSLSREILQEEACRAFVGHERQPESMRDNPNMERLSVMRWGGSDLTRVMRVPSPSFQQLG